MYLNLEKGTSSGGAFPYSPFLGLTPPPPPPGHKWTRRLPKAGARDVHEGSDGVARGASQLKIK